MDLLEKLRKSTVFWSRMGFAYDPPIYDENGDIMLISKETEKYAKYHDQFADIGVDVHSHIVHSGWLGVDKYDYSLCDSTLDAIFSSGKVKYLIPRVKLNVPPEWCRENPEDTFVYYEGPRKAEDIKSLCCTLKHDWLGYEAPDGYYNAGAWKDTRPNVGGLISLQSFSSEKWLYDAGKALENFIAHVENGKYGERIIAYHIAYGACGESMLWGRNSGKFGDYGINNMKNFVSWGARKYGSVEETYKMWGITPDDEPVPPPTLREKAMPLKEGKELFKSIEKDRRSLDYDMFMNDVNVHALEVLSSVAKRVSGGKPVGAFYGYVLHMERCAYTGHLAWDKLLEIPDMDFFAAPKSYFRSGAGEPGGEMVPAVTINRKKLWMDECDIRTYLAVGDTLAKHLEISDNVAQTQTVMLREMCKNISHNSSMWYMDLGGGWYDDRELLDYLKLLISAKKRLDMKNHKSTAQVVAVVDEKSIMYNFCPEFNKTIEKSLRNLQLCGAEIDVILSSDIGNHDFKNIKLVFMLNGYNTSADEVKKLKNKLDKNCYVMWINAGGITGETFSLENSLNVTGFEIDFSSDFTGFEIVGGVETPISYGKDGKCIIGANKDGDILSVVYDDCVEDFRKALEFCGVDIIAPVYTTVYADNRIYSVFANRDVSFRLCPTEGKLFRNMTTGQKLEAETEIILRAKEGIAFEIHEK